MSQTSPIEIENWIKSCRRSISGRKGYDAVIEKYCYGDEEKYLHYLREICAWNYWVSCGLSMKYDAFGKAIWPERKPLHPSHNRVIPF